MSTESTESTESTVAIVECDDGELHDWDDYRHAPHPVYLCLSPGTWELSCYSRRSDGIPMDVYHGKRMEWTIPALKGWAANELMESITDEATRVCAGYDERWSGNNWVGVLDDDAQDAVTEIARACERAFDRPDWIFASWDAGEWFGALGGWEQQCEEFGIESDTTDANLAIIADAADDPDNGDGCDEIRDVQEHFEWLREKAREAVSDLESEAIDAIGAFCAGSDDGSPEGNTLARAAKKAVDALDGLMSRAAIRSLIRDATDDTLADVRAMQEFLMSD